MNKKTSLLICFVLTLAAAVALSASSPIGSRYATDAYPGFDSEGGILEAEQKELGIFSWWTGPKKDTAAEQLEYAASLAADENYKKAAKEYDALVAAWPTSNEAAKAQKELADIYFDYLDDSIAAFDEYKYLIDFFSSTCDYDAAVNRLYESAKRMQNDGKKIMFFRFANTTDVRRAFEAVVVRAPGASFAPKAMMTIAELREKEGLMDKAIEVYETLRNIHSGTEEASEALVEEARVRMKALEEHSYNRPRCRDTIAYLRMAIPLCRDSDGRERLDEWLAEAVSHIEDEAFAAAKFYDSRTRTRENAINAYERFLKEYPASVHAEEARARLAELKSENGSIQ